MTLESWLTLIGELCLIAPLFLLPLLFFLT